jgi:hypothetical protein
MPGRSIRGRHMRGGNRNQAETNQRQQIEMNWNFHFLRQRALSPHRFEA